MSCAITATAHVLLESRRRDRGETETDKLTQGESEGEGGDDQKDCGP